MAAFRDIFSEFTAAGAQVLGISIDDLDTQKRFAESLKLQFPLLADPDQTVAKAYGVLASATQKDAAGNDTTTYYAKRVTFVIDKDGKIVGTTEGKDALDPAGALSACHKPASP